LIFEADAAETMQITLSTGKRKHETEEDAVIPCLSLLSLYYEFFFGPKSINSGVLPL
jgi:hypothetical protein